MSKPILGNVMEEIVCGLVRFLLHGPEYQTFCHCSNCEMEIAATVLNNLSPYYVASNEAREEAFKQLKTTENINAVNQQIIRAIYLVGKQPNHIIRDAQ